MQLNGDFEIFAEGKWHSVSGTIDQYYDLIDPGIKVVHYPPVLGLGTRSIDFITKSDALLNHFIPEHDRDIKLRYGTSHIISARVLVTSVEMMVEALGVKRIKVFFEVMGQPTFNNTKG